MPGTLLQHSQVIRPGSPVAYNLHHGYKVDQTILSTDFVSYVLLNPEGSALWTPDDNVAPVEGTLFIQIGLSDDPL